MGFGVLGPDGWRSFCVSLQLHRLYDAGAFL